MNRRAQYLELLGLELWTLRGARAARQPAVAAVPSAERVPEPHPQPVVASAEACAAAGVAAADWERLAAEVSVCTRCALCSGRTQTVFGVGDRRAQLLVIGEAPGAEEDRRGEPFVGRAGQLLNSMLQAIGCARASVYIANILKCRPPGNRDPSPTEVAACLPYLERQIELLAPRLILVVGRIAAQNLLATDQPIGRLRGSVHRLGSQAIPVVVTYHPAYLLRSPSEKRRAWVDLKLARSELERARRNDQQGARSHMMGIDATVGSGRLVSGAAEGGAYTA